MSLSFLQIISLEAGHLLTDLSLKWMKKCTVGELSAQCVQVDLKFELSLLIFRPPGYERVYLPLCKVADTPFHIQGDDLLFNPPIFSQSPYW